jgi:prepilin-type N-terminal cleavage/methylation domain-containing protein
MRNAPKGFTLIEVMLALLITSMCVALVMVSFSTTFKAHVRARQHMDLLLTTNQTADRLRTLIQSAYISPYDNNQVFTPFESMDIDKLNEPWDALTFATMAYTTHKIDAKEADLQEVTIFVEENEYKDYKDDATLGRLRVRVGGDINDRFEVDGGKVFTLADNVSHFFIEYLEETGEWKTEYFPIDHGNSLPCAIRINMAIHSDGLSGEDTKITIPMEMSKHQCKFDDERIFEEW